MKLIYMIIFLIFLSTILFTSTLRKKYMIAISYSVIFVLMYYLLSTHDFSDMIPLPMLVHNYKHVGNSIQYPCLIQKKLNGVRCMAIPQKGLFSRYRNSFTQLEHIREEINRLPPNLVLDGELYSDTLGFQELTEEIKRNILDNSTQLQIKYHVYDIMTDEPYTQRYEHLQELFHQTPFKHLVLVDNEECESEQHMKEIHDRYVADGYEGVILRNKRGLYVHERSVNVQKYEEFLDTVAMVVGFKSDVGKNKGCIVWIVEYEDRYFACPSLGPHEFRRKQFQQGAQYIGKPLTVRYQGKTEDGRLISPVGIAIRDYE